MEQKIKKLIEKWQAKLGLQDWWIDFKVADNVSGEVRGHKLWADVLPDRRNKRATIRLAKKEIRKQGFDIESVIVHELAHIMVAESVMYKDDIISSMYKLVREGDEMREENVVVRLVGALMEKNGQKTPRVRSIGKRQK